MLVGDNMGDKDRQHTVPKAYLKHFADVVRKGQYYLHMYDRAIGKVVHTNINNVAIERDFYTLDALEDPMEWENFYSKQIEPIQATVGTALIERANSCLTRNRSIVFPPNVQASLAMLMVYQLYRGRAARKFAEQLSAQTIPETVADIREKVGDASIVAFDEAINRIISNPKYIKPLLAEVMTDPKRLQNIAAYFIRTRIWVLYRIIGNREFITSDNPVMFVNNQTGDPMPYHNGLARSTTATFYPISPQLLLATYAKDNGLSLYESIDKRIVFIDAERDARFIDSHNKWQYQQCDRQVFASSENVLDKICCH